MRRTTCMRSVLVHGLLVSVGLTASAAGEATRLASSARFDLTADDRVGALEHGQVVAGEGSIERPNWVPESQQILSYTVQFPVVHFGWREVAIRFTPRSSGSVRLSLMGPWEQAPGGGIYCQEVDWDALQVDGARIENGGFEQGDAGWENSGAKILEETRDVRGVEGKRFARTWHNATLSTSLQVTGGQPVTIHAFTRAARPAGFREPRRVERRDTPAHRAARRFLRGANLGNGLEVPPGQNWGVVYTVSDLEQIRAEGFDHVRIPIGWHHHTGGGPEYRIRQDFFEKVDGLVQPALGLGLNVMINIHHFDEFTSNPAKLAPKFYAIWRQIAEHYADAPEGLAFELLNEPKDAATTEVVNPIFAEAVRQIRKSNPSRTIAYGPGLWNAISELPRLRVPDHDLNLLVTVHCYDPFPFTHQGASWAGNNDDRKVVGIVFPGPPERPLVPDPALRLTAGFRNWIAAYNSNPPETNPCSPAVLRQAARRIREWSNYYGRPVYLGEFGVYTTADPTSRANYYRAFREVLEAEGIGWAIWDWKASFIYWNEAEGRPEPGMREALFGAATSPREFKRSGLDP
jgi:endoglucanase